jgi:hypothetical protein
VVVLKLFALIALTRVEGKFKMGDCLMSKTHSVHPPPLTLCGRSAAYACRGQLGIRTGNSSAVF